MLFAIYRQKNKYYKFIIIYRFVYGSHKLSMNLLQVSSYVFTLSIIFFIFFRKRILKKVPYFMILYINYIIYLNKIAGKK